MTASPAPHRFAFLAGFIAGRAVEIANAAPGEKPHTNGEVVFVSPGGSPAQQRREIILQSALLGAGSLEPRLVGGLRARPAAARRYLALEGRRALAALAERVPLITTFPLDGAPVTATAAESLDMAGGRAHVAPPPAWFGAINPSRLSAPAAPPAPQTTHLWANTSVDDQLDEDDDDSHAERSRILRLFEMPLSNPHAVADFLRRLLGSARSRGHDAAGGEAHVGSIRRSHSVGPEAKPLPTPIRFTGDSRPGAALGVGGALFPEWDVHHNRYRADWCRVIDFPLTTAADASIAAVPRDDVLRKRLSRIGLSHRVLRGRADGDELDTEALIDFAIDLRCGYSPPEHVYLDRRKLRRDLSVLVLLDASGSTTDTDPTGSTVHEHQRLAAATLAGTLEQLGDRVAVYAFYSQGRRAVYLPAVKTFAQRFGAVGRARLGRLEPSGYTRLGAGIRGAGAILKADAGTSNRLLVLLSDGFPYDAGYEGHYAEADTRRALEELRADGVACLCLSIGRGHSVDALLRVFGGACHAVGETLADLSPRMDELFLGSLRELAAPNTQRR